MSNVSQPNTDHKNNFPQSEDTIPEPFTPLWASDTRRFRSAYSSTESSPTKHKPTRLTRAASAPPQDYNLKSLTIFSRDPGAT